jgi:hypothetical protein
VGAPPVELAVAQDEEHDELERAGDNDENLYSLGSIAGHNVAIVCLPAGRIGYNPAAVMATQMKVTFKGIRFGLSAATDIRLGDVVVSQPDKMEGKARCRSILASWSASPSFSAARQVRPLVRWWADLRRVQD